MFSVIKVSLYDADWFDINDSNIKLTFNHEWYKKRGAQLRDTPYLREQVKVGELEQGQTSRPSLHLLAHYEQCFGFLSTKRRLGYILYIYTQI